MLVEKNNKKIPLNFMVINGLDYPYSSLDLPWWYNFGGLQIYLVSKQQNKIYFSC